MKLMSPVTKMLLALLSRNKQNALCWYARSIPSAQNALDIFRGDWISRLPGPLSQLPTGTANLFDDERVHWFAKEIGGFEANTRAFLKCLVVKELFDLHHVSFLCGDFLEYLRHRDDTEFDLCVACGVLYHMENPAELIALLVSRSGILAAKFGAAKAGTHAGFEQTLHRKEYGPTLYWSGFCGGTASVCQWMKREDILRCLPDHRNGPAFAVTATKIE